MRLTCYLSPMLHAPYDSDNIFAKILAGDIPAAVIAQTPRTLAFMDAFPQSKGHCLVIPKNPCRNILDAARKDLSAVIDQTQVVARAVEKALSPDGIIVTQFNGASAGQTVFHLHMHIIPRYADAQMSPHAQSQGGSGQADMDELQALAAKIREHIA